MSNSKLPILDLQFLLMKDIQIKINHIQVVVEAPAKGKARKALTKTQKFLNNTILQNQRQTLHRSLVKINRKTIKEEHNRSKDKENLN